MFQGDVGWGVMSGRHYTSVTPVTLNLSTSRVNPRFHSILPIRHQQQLQYEPESAKCFIYRTQMHIQNCFSNNTLPDIKSKSSNLNRVKYERFSSVEEINDRSEELLPNLRPCNDVSTRQNFSRKGSCYSVRNVSQVDRLKEPALSVSPESETEELAGYNDEKCSENSRPQTDLNKDSVSSKCQHINDNSSPHG